MTLCGRYTIRRIDRPFPGWEPYNFETFDDKRIVPRFNAAPTQSLPILRRTPSSVELSAMRWGLVPSWATDKKLGASMINARGETVATKPAFRSAFAKRRCLVPADGFYEWQKRDGEKVPHFIHLKTDESFVFAGLWEFWPVEKLETFTIVTTTPNALMEPFHDRMPVMLTAAGADRWTAPDATPDELQSLLVPYDADLMDAYPVGKTVGSPRNEGPELIAPVG